MITNFREQKIKELQKRAEGCSFALTKTYRHDLVLIWLECQKEIQIQMSYKEIEDASI